MMSDINRPAVLSIRRHTLACSQNTTPSAARDSDHCDVTHKARSIHMTRRNPLGRDLEVQSDDNDLQKNDNDIQKDKTDASMPSPQDKNGNAVSKDDVDASMQSPQDCNDSVVQEDDTDALTHSSQDHNGNDIPVRSPRRKNGIVMAPSQSSHHLFQYSPHFQHHHNDLVFVPHQLPRPLLSLHHISSPHHKSNIVASSQSPHPLLSSHHIHSPHHKNSTDTPVQSPSRKEPRPVHRQRGGSDSSMLRYSQKMSDISSERRTMNASAPHQTPSPSFVPVEIHSENEHFTVDTEEAPRKVSSDSTMMEVTQAWDEDTDRKITQRRSLPVLASSSNVARHKPISVHRPSLSPKLDHSIIHDQSERVYGSSAEANHGSSVNSGLDVPEAWVDERDTKMPRKTSLPAVVLLPQLAAQKERPASFHTTDTRVSGDEAWLTSINKLERPQSGNGTSPRTFRRRPDTPDFFVFRPGMQPNEFSSTSSDELDENLIIIPFPDSDVFSEFREDLFNLVEEGRQAQGASPTQPPKSKKAKENYWAQKRNKTNQGNVVRSMEKITKSRKPAPSPSPRLRKILPRPIPKIVGKPKPATKKTYYHYFRYSDVVHKLLLSFGEHRMTTNNHSFLCRESEHWTFRM